jgi:predicted  nucleic acid-binding Zn-ribbon protein
MTSELISRIVELCSVDATIARIIAEKKKLEADAVKQKQNYLSFAKTAGDKVSLFDTKQKAFKAEENFLKTEREKITTRRKELSSLNNYKVQQAAEKELDFAVRQIQVKEEALLATVDELDKLETESKQAQVELKDLRAKVEAFLKEAQETIPSLDERMQRQTVRRQELLQFVNPAYLQQYEKVRAKYPTDAVVALNSQAGCSGCNMSVGPQIIQKVMKGESIDKCPGCGRILYMTQEVQQSLQGN